ncbi:transcriptional regulator [Steroidobacter agaridevorans]|uniref:Transcriptional regulator n=1 Tax=Steroidobacter agaridevorans TaxID=2695856 RepID=A0A829YKB0_9GAMM|nr:GntR family transcriptional regulator [Steroidobacter agaridevorans]GFE83680.1 transcriptional regulator [Steroidobacter agaridevorans]
MTDQKIKKPKSLTLLALEKIRAGITNGEYPLGSPLYEKALAERFGFSKTPVREALVQLQRENLVVVQPHSGTFVFELADKEVTELCELRLILESNALQLAMRRQSGRLLVELDGIVKRMCEAIKNQHTEQYRRLDGQFHAAFFKHCGNVYLAGAYSMIDAKLQTLRVSLIAPIPSLLDISLDEHLRIANTLKDDKIEVALKVLSEHIKRARELMRGLREVEPVTVEAL